MDGFDIQSVIWTEVACPLLLTGIDIETVQIVRRGCNEQCVNGCSIPQLSILYIERLCVERAVDRQAAFETPGGKDLSGDTRLSDHTGPRLVISVGENIKVSHRLPRGGYRLANAPRTRSISAIGSTGGSSPRQATC